MAANTAHVVCLISLFILVCVSCDNDHGSEAFSYDKNAFQSNIEDKKHFVMFFAPWCGHCKRLAPTWDELAKVYNNDESSVTIAKVDCTVETALCSDHDVTGYPTLKFFHKNTDDFQRYKGNRDLDSLKKFVEEQASQGTDSEDKQPTQDEEQEAKVLEELTDDTFDNFIEKGFHFVKFYAPWCGHCKKLAPTWEELARSLEGNEKVVVSKVDCTLSTKLCNAHRIRGYPTLILFNKGEKIEQYQGSRSLDDLKNFVTKKMKEDTEGAVETFKKEISEGLAFVKFFVPWCGHCKRLAPTWEELVNANKGRKGLVITKVDCTVHKSVCGEYEVNSYPTLVLFENGDRRNDYRGANDLESLQEFVDSHLERSQSEEEQTESDKGHTEL